MNLSVIGGDRRQSYIAQHLIKSGMKVTVFAIIGDVPEAKSAESLRDALSAADVVVLPIPVSRDGINLNSHTAEIKISLSEIIPLIRPGCKVFGGIIPKILTDAASTKGLQIFDYGLDESITIKNAVPTAEAALMLAIRDTEHTISGSRVMVCGFGRIGKVLARMLKCLRADVYVSARRESDISWIEALGYNAVNTYEISAYLENVDLIFNTVPHLIIDENSLSKCKSSVYIIDLASGNGGVDFEAAAKLGIQTNHALSLPGRTAPASSGEYIAKTIIDKTAEKGA